MASNTKSKNAFLVQTHLSIPKKCKAIKTHCRLFSHGQQTCVLLPLEQHLTLVLLLIILASVLIDSGLRPLVAGG